MQRMNICSRRFLAPAASLLFLTPALAQEAPPSAAEMWRIIQEQQREIERLKGQLVETDQKVEATGDRVEEVATQDMAAGTGWWERTSLGAYGELHYNGGEADEIDFHRFVVFLGHEFTDRIRLFSEVEIEHAYSGDDEPGEVELEQAFVEFDLTDRTKAKGGLFLVPVGIINETHEPPTFFGVERNIVESRIIPTTWREGGVAFNAMFGAGFSADAAVHSGLNTPTIAEDADDAFLIRGGRQNTAQAEAENPAATLRLRWTGMPGVELAASAQYQDDITQNDLGVEAFLIETHADIRRGPWWLRALYARWDLNGDEPEDIGRDEQYGWYVEPAYIFDLPRGGDLGVFTRYAKVDNEAGDSADSDWREIHFGVNYWPIPDVVLKADYQFQDAPSGEDDDDRINLGIGFVF
jgi:hypothetical protein